MCMLTGLSEPERVTDGTTSSLKIAGSLLTLCKMVLLWYRENPILLYFIPASTGLALPVAFVVVLSGLILHCLLDVEAQGNS